MRLNSNKGQRTAGGGAFAVGVCVLVLVAALQVGAVAWHVLFRIPAVAEAGTALPGNSNPSKPIEQAVARNAEIRRQSTALNEILSEPMTEPRGVSQATPPTDPTDSATPPLAPAITDAAVLTYLEKGRGLSAAGEMHGALSQFRAAAELMPQHPKILYALASTYGKMGLPKKASDFWEAIYRMGPDTGHYYTIADFQLRGIQTDPGVLVSEPRTGGREVPITRPDFPDMASAEVAIDDPSVTSSAEENFGADIPDDLLSIGKVVSERDGSVNNGERVVLNISVESKPGMRFDPSQVDVYVIFYDKVNNTRIDQTIAYPSERWVTLPIDWKGENVELLEVTYFQPKLTDEEVLEFGQRSYHGYSVQVFYRGKLQDLRSEPATLEHQIPTSGEAQPEEPMIDPSLFRGRP